MTDWRLSTVYSTADQLRTAAGTFTEPPGLMWVTSNLTAGTSTPGGDSLIRSGAGPHVAYTVSYEAIWTSTDDLPIGDVSITVDGHFASATIGNSDEVDLAWTVDAADYITDGLPLAVTLDLVTPPSRSVFCTIIVNVTWTTAADAPAGWTVGAVAFARQVVGG